MCDKAYFYDRHKEIIKAPLEVFFSTEMVILRAICMCHRYWNWKVKTFVSVRFAEYYEALSYDSNNRGSVEGCKGEILGFRPIEWCLLLRLTPVLLTLGTFMNHLSRSQSAIAVCRTFL